MLRVKNDELSLLLSPPEGDVRASLVLAKYKFCGHKFNNKTYKMKKFLLFLSCFLTTWCSVQAANPQINSVTYNESSSTFSVSYTSNSSNNSVWMICQATGPVGSRVTLGSSPATVNLPITARDGEYNLILYVNGSPCYQKSVTVTKYGHIDKISNISTSKVTVNYSMFHSKSDNFPEKSYLRIVGVANTTREISNVKNGSYTWTGLNLAPGQYTCEMYGDGKRLDTKSFTVTSGDAVKLTPMGGNRLKIDFTLSSTGYVKFMVHTYSLTGGKGESKPVDYGQCDTYAGTKVVDVPYYSGYVGYAVELIKNGTSVNGASVTAYNR